MESRIEMKQAIDSNYNEANLKRLAIEFKQEAELEKGFAKWLVPWEAKDNFCFVGENKYTEKIRVREVLPNEQTALEKFKECASSKLELAIKYDKLVDKFLIAKEALHKLKDGPGNKMEGWKLTWAHELANKALEKIAELGAK